MVVFEIGDEGTQACGKYLADMGASVTKVEPPAGAGSRYRGPFFEGNEDPDRSVYFWAHNTNKASVTIDLEDGHQRDLLRSALSRADVVLEDHPPGYLAQLGLGYDQLSAANPALVMTSITPFGQTGPLAQWKGSDMVAWAMGGAMSMVGYSDAETPPLVPRGDLSFQIAGQWAGIGTLAALLGRDLLGGAGQHVDISVQESVAFITDGYGVVPFEYTGTGVTRRDMPNLVRTGDGGYLVAQMLNISPDRWVAFRDWLRANGLGAGLEAIPPAEFESHRDLLLKAVEEVASTRTGAELFRLGQSFGFTWMAVNTPAQLLEDEQLLYRGFFRDVEHPELARSIRYPGPAAHWSEAPWCLRSRPPLLGEDNLAFGLPARGTLDPPGHVTC